MEDKQIKCCLCGKSINNMMDSHNPSPLNRNDDDRCCGGCNLSFVVPARIAMIGLRNNAILSAMRDNSPKQE